MKKLLLLSNIPPCGLDAGGLVIEKLCRFLPPGSLACFATLEPYWLGQASVSAELGWMPLQTEPDAGRGFSNATLNRLCAPAFEWSARSTVTKLVAKAVEFGRAFGADAVWCHLAGQTMIRMALPVATRLGVPLYTQILDPPEFWFTVDRVPGLSRRLLAKQFAATLRASAACAAISDPMREQYEQEYGIRTVSIFPALDASMCVAPAARQLRSDSELAIGVAGNLHQLPAWNSLIAALQAVDWKIGGRNVRLRVLGRSAPVYTSSPVNIEFLGWWPQAGTIRLLAETDVLYCPSWFGAENAAQARLSFPSKLAAYFAAGRPVLFHGPTHASPVQFLTDHDAAACCHSLDTHEIIGTLAGLVSDRELYARLVANGRQAFEKLLTTEVMRSRFAEFLDVPLDRLRPASIPPADVGSIG